MTDKPTSSPATPTADDDQSIAADDMDAGGRAVFGIRRQLFLAFCGMAALTVLAAAIAWYAFRQIDQSVERITGDSIPAMSRSLRLAAQSAEISALAPALMASTDQEQRAEAQARLDKWRIRLAGLLNELQTAGLDPGSVAELLEAYQLITKKLNDLNTAVEGRLTLKTRRETLVNDLARVHTDFLERLELLVDDAVFDMVISSEDLTARSSGSITELVDGGVLVLNQLMATSAEANLAAGLLTEAANIADPSIIQPLRERFTASAATIDRTLKELPDSGAKLGLQHAVNALLGIGMRADSIFDVRERQLRKTSSPGNAQAIAPAGVELEAKRKRMIAELRAAHQELIETLVPMVDDATFDLAISSEQIASRSREDITELVDGGVNTLQLLLSMRADGNLAAGLLVESAGILDPSLLEPLRERFTAAASHVEKSLQRLPESLDKTALRDVVTPLLAFGEGRESIFALRRRELDRTRSAEALLETSHRLAAGLSDNVAGLVASAESNSDQAGARSEDAIAGGKMLLLVITGVSIVGAAFLMLFLVGRRVISPLEAITGAMTDLAQGNTSVEIPALRRTDEVGSMAGALKVFRDTAVEVRETNLRELRKAQRRLSDAIESISEGFSLYDRDDRLVVCNTRYRQILYPGMHDVVTPGTPFETLIREAAQAGLVRDAEGRIDEWVQERMALHRDPSGLHLQRRSDGRSIRVNERKTEDGGTVAVYTDITEDQRREEELRAAKETAERTLQELTETQQSLVHAEKMASLGQLTAGIAHEIKNPLNFVNNFADSSTELLDELVEDLESPLAAVDKEKREETRDQIDNLR
ncbi:MAG: HAMP domain-containing protein, partial [Gammaproteobacteria bacterium]|nr:HAMP domain-containing protein [Gammaproteobacteria bacterium]NIR81718.1 HAMP domain-containing protein [Gammaproteobacteria bacterium]NIR88521.1 HAMP domain-containing protein [Gammaproteobacteria bacterium]NIU02825.1 HAMP domain-containing protein [Gammaproteobacteria bacterium]NIV50347.1 HAMP domain-containing protein [Gammaproteobacteria bacterium]